MSDTATHRRHPYTHERYNELGGYFVMNTETDVAPLIELLKMADERWPRSGSGQVSQSDYSAEIIRCLKCGRKRADAQESEGVNFRLE